jgi:hypothetical protein
MLGGMRPLLKPALRRLWRDGTTLQLGVETDRALVLLDVGPTEAAFLAGLDGTADRRAVLAGGAALGLNRRDAAALLDLLADHDALDDASLEPLPGLDQADRDRLAPDLAALSLTQCGPGAAGRTLARRGTATVTVEGAGRVGAALVGLLAAAGVGRVVPIDPKPLRPGDLGPAGPGSTELGLTRAEAAIVAARRTVPSLRHDSTPSPSLTVLTPDTVVDPVRRDRLTAAGLAHLPATVLEDCARVGPLVRPGETPCLACVDLHHADRDPAWPVLLAQLTADTHPVPACDVALATLVAALTARLALAYLDGPATPAQAGAAYALTGRDAVPRARTYGFHPACGCRWGERP